MLQVSAVVRAARCCRCWARLARPLPMAVTDSQVMDVALTFCLLEVLFNFSEARLPFPLTAVYGEMCAVARRATAVCELSTRMASFVISTLGTPGATSSSLE